MKPDLSCQRAAGGECLIVYFHRIPRVRNVVPAALGPRARVVEQSRADLAGRAALLHLDVEDGGPGVESGESTANDIMRLEEAVR